MKVKTKKIEGWSKALDVELPDDALVLQMKDDGEKWVSVAFVMGNTEHHLCSIKRMYNAIKMVRINFDFRIIEAKNIQR